jgi:hypothetical protein
LGLMQTSLRSRLSRMPHQRHIKDETKNGLRNFSLDGSSHQTGDADVIPATLQDSHYSRANTDSHNSQNSHNTREHNKINFALSKRTLSPARHVLKDTSHQTRGNSALSQRAGSSEISWRSLSFVKKTLHRHRAGFEAQRASPFIKRVKAPPMLGEATRA